MFSVPDALLTMSCKHVLVMLNDFKNKYCLNQNQISVLETKMRNYRDSVETEPAALFKRVTTYLTF